MRELQFLQNKNKHHYRMNDQGALFYRYNDAPIMKSLKISDLKAQPLAMMARHILFDGKLNDFNELIRAFTRFYPSDFTFISLTGCETTKEGDTK